MAERLKRVSIESEKRVSHPAFYLTNLNKSEVEEEEGRGDHCRKSQKGWSRLDSLPIHNKLNVCGIVLAGGEGERLRCLVHRLRGDMLPKQYVNFIGTRSMLENTFCRAERLIPADRLLTVINWAHLRYAEVRRQISSRPRESVIVQPENKGTGAGFLLPLMHVHKRDPESVVVVFPSDHFVLEETRFMSHVYFACRAVEQDPSRLVLLGIEPDKPDREYGYIVPYRKSNLSSLSLCPVLRFVEKPALDVAHELILAGGLWNTMVMAFRASTLLDLVRQQWPAIYWKFHRVQEVIGSPFEKAVVEETYKSLKPVNLSRDLLERLALRHTSRLQVLPVRGVFWEDWGLEHRIAESLNQTGYQDRLREILGEKAHQDLAQGEVGNSNTG